MFKMSKEPVKVEYASNVNKKVKVGRNECEVRTQTLNTRSGTYTKGFKFHTTTIAYLTRTKKVSKYYNPTLFSLDHGVTWGNTFNEAKKLAGRKRIVLKKTTTTEFAYDAIQGIRQRYNM